MNRQLSRFLFAGGLAAVITLTNASAQSSGNFAAKIDTAACVVNNSTGALSGGETETILQTTIQTPKSSQTAFVIPPSPGTRPFQLNKTTPTNPPPITGSGGRGRVLVDR